MPSQGTQHILPDVDHKWALLRWSGNGIPEMDFARVDKNVVGPPSTTICSSVEMERYFARPLLLWMPRKLWQDYKAAIEELETGDPDVQGENDEGFVELVEFQGLTVPVLETALPLVGTFRPTPTPSTNIQYPTPTPSTNIQYPTPTPSTNIQYPTPTPSTNIQSTAASVSPMSSTPVRATPPPGPLSSTPDYG
ncbi:allergen Asp f 7 homolog [Salmo trutta]|uniref:allergen Asp f 7 homolog n=1 Tax=Salmo trutta TaxID=8032 RepID=UPI0011311D3D|nr:allergen Asp f 7 homolog [Salmo trutta]